MMQLRVTIDITTKNAGPVADVPPTELAVIVHGLIEHELREFVKLPWVIRVELLSEESE